MNRIWHQLFGLGLVRTVDNFGWLGERPSHPELLDYLACEFVETHKWSVKSFIARLLLTQTYGQSSKSAEATFDTRDPNNVLLHRMPVRRLEAEAIRDSVLAVSGRLASKVGGKLKGMMTKLKPRAPRGRPSRWRRSPGPLHLGPPELPPHPHARL